MRRLIAWIIRRGDRRFVDRIVWYTDPFQITLQQIRCLPETPYDWERDGA